MTLYDKNIIQQKTLIGRLHQYFLIYFETFSVPTADTLFLLILSILTLCYNLSSASPPWIFLLFWCYHLTINGCAKIPTTNWFYGGDNWVLWQIKRWLKAFNCQLNYKEFQNHVADLEASIHATDNKIQQTRLAIQNQQVIQKHCEVYRACRDIIRAQNLVFTNFRRLKNCSDNRWNWKKNCPQPKKKQDLQKQQNTLHIIEKNFDAMIRKAGIKVPEKAPSPRILSS